ncbi:hypothetical protein NECID01_0977 [Nematocida sp. AWRm77]|nr:hypothetical protein NECID01_0977 [Nematocida sp. AWRm77]
MQIRALGAASTAALLVFGRVWGKDMPDSTERKNAVIFCKDAKGGMSIPFLEIKEPVLPKLLFYKKGLDKAEAAFTIDTGIMEKLELTNIALSEPFSLGHTNAFYSALPEPSSYTRIVILRINTKPNVQLNNTKVVYLSCIKNELLCEEMAYTPSSKEAGSSLSETVNTCKAVENTRIKEFLNFSNKKQVWRQNLVFNPSTGKFEITNAILTETQSNVLEMMAAREYVSITEISPLDPETFHRIKKIVQKYPSSFFHIESNTPRGWILFLTVYRLAMGSEPRSGFSSVDSLPELFSIYLAAGDNSNGLLSIIHKDIAKAKSLFLGSSDSASSIRGRFNASEPRMDAEGRNHPSESPSFSHPATHHRHKGQNKDERKTKIYNHNDITSDDHYADKRKEHGQREHSTHAKHAGKRHRRKKPRRYDTESSYSEESSSSASRTRPSRY